MLERYSIKRGLDIPISGQPDSSIDRSRSIQRVAIVGDDYIGMRPTVLVAVGDLVRCGQPVLEDKKTPGVLFTAPISGRVTAVERGAKRRFLSLIIDQSDVDLDQLPPVTWEVPGGGDVQAGEREQWVELLRQSGLWTALRTRPFGRVPALDGSPRAIFVNCMETNPLAADPAPIIADAKADFEVGLGLLRRLSSGPIYVCRRAGDTTTPGEGIDQVRLAEFSGPHPAGLPGTHMHMISPATTQRVNWYLNYQDVIAFGRLVQSGRLNSDRIVALSGPMIKRPRLVVIPLGASIEQLIAGELTGDGARVVSGSVLCGRQAVGAEAYLGRYHLQVSALAEGNQRELLGWQMPGFDKFSITRAFAAAWTKPGRLPLNTSTGGSQRAMVPIGTYEKVMPLDLIPTLLLRSLISRDTNTAQELGCLELEEEDLGLCTFVCPGKYDYGSILRDNLTMIEQEG